jgi:D-alanyl-D-alanine carboxypeptidase
MVTNHAPQMKYCRNIMAESLVRSMGGGREGGGAKSEESEE